MSEKLFPARVRCKSCRGKLGDVSRPAVLCGLYCSPRCAGLAAVIEIPGKAPRECVTQREGRWTFKRRYRSVTEIPDVIKDDPTSNHYWCNNCWHLHIGHSRIDNSKETHRIFRDVADLADTLVKARGKATRKQVAAAAGIRPIRLRELEEPGSSPTVDLAALFKVMAVLQLKPAAVFAR